MKTNCKYRREGDKTYSWGRGVKTVQRVKLLLPKPSNLSLVPGSHVKAQMQECMSVTPSLLCDRRVPWANYPGRHGRAERHSTETKVARETDGESSLTKVVL